MLCTLRKLRERPPRDTRHVLRGHSRERGAFATSKACANACPIQRRLTGLGVANGRRDALCPMRGSRGTRSASPCVVRPMPSARGFLAKRWYISGAMLARFAVTAQTCQGVVSGALAGGGTSAGPRRAGRGDWGRAGSAMPGMPKKGGSRAGAGFREAQRGRGSDRRSRAGVLTLPASAWRSRWL